MKNTPKVRVPDFDPVMVELGKRLLALPAFRYSQPSGCLRDEDGIQWMPSDEADWNSGGSGFQIPWLADAGTRGVVLELARKENADPGLHLVPLPGPNGLLWGVHHADGRGRVWPRFESEAEILVWAVEMGVPF